MSEQEQNEAIAKALGVAPRLAEWWVHSASQKAMAMTGTQKECLEWFNSLPFESPYAKGDWEVVPHYVYPDYVNDLNVMHEAEKVLMKQPVNIWKTYASFIAKSVHNEWGSSAHEADFSHATAAQRSEALLRTLNLWKEP